MLPLTLAAAGEAPVCSAPRLTNSTTTVSLSTVTVDGTVEADFKVTLKDSFGNTISGSSCRASTSQTSRAPRASATKVAAGKLVGQPDTVPATVTVKWVMLIRPRERCGCSALGSWCMHEVVPAVSA